MSQGSLVGGREPGVLIEGCGLGVVMCGLCASGL